MYMQTDIFNTKPQCNIGLWSSPAKTDEWRHWCEAENFRTKDLEKCFKFNVCSDAKILMAFNQDGVFSEKFKKYLFNEEDGEYKRPDWEKIFEDFDGFLYDQSYILRPDVHNNMEAWYIFGTFDVTTLIVFNPSIVLVNKY